jgi:hypothetical protein
MSFWKISATNHAIFTSNFLHRTLLVSFLCLRAFFDGKLVIGIDFVADYFDYQ